ncbi:TIGR04104 family putative zinc finger protein [Planococcus shenhongbingii]|uniref:TIGR04104 family putative zinc finger protein n=1 Tax=Planococcus shenhongbingii TaxID=3058398 RepID=UPI00345D85A8
MQEVPKCTNCKSQWSWKQTIRKTFTLKSKLDCPVCGKSQYISGKSRKKLGALNLVILLPLFFNVYMSTNPLLVITAIFTLFFITLVFIPFLTKLSDKEEPLW